MSPADACPKCRGRMTPVEKDSSSGRVMRSYRCEACGHTEDRDEGKALWEILHEENEREDGGNGPNPG